MNELPAEQAQAPPNHEEGVVRRLQHAVADPRFLRFFSL